GARAPRRSAEWWGGQIQPAAPRQRVDNVQHAFTWRERKSLWPPERRRDRSNLAVRSNPIDVIVRRERRTTGEELSSWADREVECRDTGRQHGKRLGPIGADRKSTP